MKVQSWMAICAMMIALLVSTVSAAEFTGTVDGATFTLTQVEVNDVDLHLDRTRNVEITDSLEIKVAYESDAELEDVQITAELTGYDRSDADLLRDTTNTFDMNGGEIYDSDLDIELPVRLDDDEVYSLKITVDTQTDRETFSFPLKVESPDELVTIRDVILSPSYGVQAGRALLATVRVDNRGDSEEDNVKVTFSIPELRLAASDYIDELEENNEDRYSKSTEELYVRIPACTMAGTYDAFVEVEYDEGDETEVAKMSVTVLEDPTCAEQDDEETSQGKTVIAVSTEPQTVTAGGNSVVYPVTIINAGTSARTYTVGVTGGDWGSFTVTPSNVVTVAADGTKTVFVSAAANAAATAGTQVFGVSISSDDTVIREVSMQANVVAGANDFDLKRALEVGLIVLVVILVILGLVIGFNRLRGDEDDDQSYY